MSDSGWTYEHLEARVVEEGKRLLSEQERVRAAKGFIGALSEMSGFSEASIDGLVERDRDRAIDEFNRDMPKRSRKPRAHPERDLQESCEALLQLDGWRIFRMEQNYSERKRKVVGEPGVPDTLAVRYLATPEKMRGFQLTSDHWKTSTELFWIEWKSLTGKPSKLQALWHAAERARGALTLIAGVDFPATVDGWLDWYRGSGLMRRKL